MLLPDLRIKNYRLFKEFEIERLARVNLIAGWNNAGKSALLEAAYLVARDDAIAALQKALDSRGEKAVTPLFHDYDLSPDGFIEIKSGEESVKLYIPESEEMEKMLGKKPNLHLSEGALPMRVQSSKDKELLNLVVDEQNRIAFHRSFLRTVPVAKRTFLLQGTDSLPDRYDEMSEKWDEISLTPHADMVIAALRIIDSRVKSLSFLSADDNVKVLLEGDATPVLIGSLGDGMRHLLMIAVLLVGARGGVLLVDEIETGLHYTALTKLWRLIFGMAKQLDVQVLATTHSWDCITAFSQAWNEVDESEGLFFRLSKKGDKIKPVVYSAERLNIASEQGIEVR